MEVIAQAYVDALVYFATTIQNENFSIDNFYSKWLDVPKISARNLWKHLGVEVYKRIAEKDLFYSKVAGGRWISLEGAIIVRPEDEVPSQVLEYLLSQSKYLEYS